MVSLLTRKQIAEKMSRENCSFFVVCGGQCGPNRGKADIVNLTDCDQDVNRHLSNCKLSRIKLNETELILARAGLFDPV